MLLFSILSSGIRFIKQFSLTLCESLANKKMTEKEKEVKHLSLLGIELSNSIP
jgi:hypothetical protein